MGVSGSAFATWVGSFFTAAGTTAAGTTAATAATTTAAGTAAAGTAAAGTAAAGAAAGTVATSAAGEIALADATAGIAAGASAPTLGAIGAGIGDMTPMALASGATSAASGLSALNTLAQGRGGINLPPQPGAVQNDQSVQNAEQASLKRAQIAGGLQSTTGTAGGQAGAVLNPSTLSTKSLLGG